MTAIDNKGSSVPRVTVLMPVFNAMPFLPEAVESIFAQTYKAFVLYAIDDGSTDGSVGYLRSLHNPRLRVLSGKAHAGLGAVLNQGLAMTETEFVARMDGDDICEPDRLQLQVDFLDRHSEIGAVGTQFTYLGRRNRTGFGRSLPLTHPEIMRQLLNGDLSLIHASLVIRTELFRAIGGYRFNGVGEDWDMFLRLGEVTSIANLPNQSYFYRIHENNATFLQGHLTHRRILYACRCAKARQLRVREPSEKEFSDELKRLPIWAKFRHTLDEVSLYRYVAGRNQVLKGRPLLGYFNLALGATIGPWRTLSRISSAVPRKTAVERG
jgi:glycosyltransferase involved in cell wall biosynthesis